MTDESKGDLVNKHPVFKEFVARAPYNHIPAPEACPAKFVTGSDVIDKVKIVDDHHLCYDNSKPLNYHIKYIGKGSYGKVYQCMFHWRDRLFSVAKKSSRLKDRCLDEVWLSRYISLTGRIPGVVPLVSWPEQNAVGMPMASGDMSDLYMTLSCPAMDQICFNLLLTLFGLMSRGFLYFDLKAKNVLYFCKTKGRIRIELGDLGSMHMDAPPGPDVSYPATHTHPYLQDDGFVCAEHIENKNNILFIYVYQVCLLYCRLLLGDAAVLPNYKNNDQSLLLLSSLCSQIKGLRSRRNLAQLGKKYLVFLEHVISDLNLGTPTKKDTDTRQKYRNQMVIAFLRGMVTDAKATTGMIH